MFTPDAQHCKVFTEVPILGFKWGKSLKDLLVMAKVPVGNETDRKSCGCQGKRCEVWTFWKKRTLLLIKSAAIHKK